MTSEYINRERIYMTTVFIYEIVVAININRVGGILFRLAIFMFCLFLFLFLGKLYSFDLSELWTGRSKN